MGDMNTESTPINNDENNPILTKFLLGDDIEYPYTPCSCIRKPSNKLSYKINYYYKDRGDGMSPIFQQDKLFSSTD